MEKQDSPQDKQVKRFLLMEEAKAKALYPYKENSIEPIAQGAWKGALLMGIGKTLHESHKNKRLSLKPALGYYGAGTILGGLAGYLNNRNKVKQAIDARHFLADGSMNSKFAKKDSMLNKHSAARQDAFDRLATEAGVHTESENKKQKTPKKSILKDMAGNGVVGSVLGGAMGLIGGLSKKKFIKGALTGGVLGATQSGVGDEVEGELAKKKKNDIATNMALSMGVSSAIEPLVYRGLGKGIGEKNTKLLLDDEYNEAEKADKIHNNTKKISTKLKQALLPNLASKFKNNYDSDNVDMLRGAKGKIIDKQLFSHMAGKTLWGGAIGYGLGKAIEKLQGNRNKT